MRQLVAGVSLVLLPAALLALASCGPQTIQVNPSPLPVPIPAPVQQITSADLTQTVTNFQNAVNAGFDVAQNSLFLACQQAINTELGIGQPAPAPGPSFQVDTQGIVSGFSVIVLDAEKIQQLAVTGIAIPESCAEVQGLINVTAIANILNLGKIPVSIVPDPAAIAALKASALKTKGRLQLVAPGKRS